MNREIKFRGKRVDNSEWVFGYLYTMPIRNTVTSFILTNDFMEEFRHGTRDYELGFHLWKDLFPVDKETVGQFTSLYDKNGKEVYEGDIVRKRDLTFELKYEGVVVYNSEIGAFRIHSENNGMTMRIGFEISDVFNDGQCTIPIKYDYEVIGNVHVNPDLSN
jgi:uncharacterized phage protein (TIGR01671 family)